LKRTLRELAELVGGQVKGDSLTEIVRCAPLELAQEGDITYVKSEKYYRFLETNRASAVITPYQVTSDKKNLLWVENPELAFAKVLGIYHSKAYRPTGIHKTAWIDPTARLGKDVSVGPFSVISEKVVLGDRVVIHSGVFIGGSSSIGENTVIYPNVSIYEGMTIGKNVVLHSGVVVGSDGFGYVKDGDRHFKIPQVGGVTIEDDVEIGANSTIDRATMGQTLIRRGVKIDNLVQVAHNVVIGENSIIVAQVGIAGSSRLGRNVILAGQVGVSDHIEIGDNVMVGAQSGVLKSIPPNQVYFGSPAMRQKESWRIVALVSRLPQIKRTLDELVRRVKQLEEKLGKK